MIVYNSGMISKGDCHEHLVNCYRSTRPSHLDSVYVDCHLATGTI